MTKTEKEELLKQKLMLANVLRFSLRKTIANVVGVLTEEQLDEHLAMIAIYQASPEFKLEDAKAFGEKLMNKFTNENISLGITQDGMTGTVRKALFEVIMCMLTGSLYDAIAEVKAIPVEKKDAKYLTNARLTQFVNDIEDYLQIPHTSVV